MKAKRSIPYGYGIKNGKIVIADREAETVKLIFNLYARGISLKEISDSLTEKGYPNSKGCVAWNKRLVHYIIENPAYCSDKYPHIIDHHVYRQANTIKSKKGSIQKSRPPALARSLICKNCESSITWQTREMCWGCRACGLRTPAMEREYLPMAIQSKMNLLIADTGKIAVPESQTAIQMAGLRREQEIQRILNAGDYEADEVLDLIMEQASLRYDRCTVGEYDPATLQIREVLASAVPAREFNGELYKQIVSKTIVADDGSVQLRLKNGQTV